MFSEVRFPGVACTDVSDATADYLARWIPQPVHVADRTWFTGGFDAPKPHNCYLCKGRGKHGGSNAGTFLGALLGETAGLNEASSPRLRECDTTAILT